MALIDGFWLRLLTLTEATCDIAFMPQQVSVSPPWAPRTSNALKRVVASGGDPFRGLRPGSVTGMSHGEVEALALTLVSPHRSAIATRRAVRTLFELDTPLTIETLRTMRGLPLDTGWPQGPWTEHLREASEARGTAASDADQATELAARRCLEESGLPLLAALFHGDQRADTAVVEAVSGSPSAASFLGFCPSESFPKSLPLGLASGFIGTGLQTKKVEGWTFCNWKAIYDYPRNPLQAIMPMTPGAFGFVLSHGYGGHMKAQTNAMAMKAWLCLIWGYGPLPIAALWLIWGLG